VKSRSTQAYVEFGTDRFGLDSSEDDWSAPVLSKAQAARLGLGTFFSGVSAGAFVCLVAPSLPVAALGAVAASLVFLVTTKKRAQ